MEWLQWVMGISAIITAVGFITLAVFLIRYLLIMRNLTKNANILMDKIYNRFSVFDSFLNKLGLTEGKGSHDSSSENMREESTASNKLLGVAPWALLGITLWKKIINRR